jgi:hypothetical protein
VYWESGIVWLVVKPKQKNRREDKVKGCFERVRPCVLWVARRVQQLSQYVNVKINGFSSFFEIVEISKL